MSLKDPQLSMLGRFSNDLAQAGQKTEFWDCEQEDMPPSVLLEMGQPHLVDERGQRMIEDLFATSRPDGKIEVVALRTEFEGPDLKAFAGILVLVQRGYFSIEEIQLIYAAAKKNLVDILQANENHRETVCGEAWAQNQAKSRIFTTIDSLFQAYGIDREQNGKKFSMPRIKSSMIHFRRIVDIIAEMAFKDLEIELFQDEISKRVTTEVHQEEES